MGELEQGCVGAVKVMKIEVEAKVASEEGSVVYVNMEERTEHGTGHDRGLRCCDIEYEYERGCDYWSGDFES